MQESIRPVPFRRSPENQDAIAKLTRLYLSHTPRADAALDEWVRAQGDWLRQFAASKTQRSLANETGDASYLDPSR